jgi:hypothetical protein
VDKAKLKLKVHEEEMEQLKKEIGVESSKRF